MRISPIRSRSKTSSALLAHILLSLNKIICLGTAMCDGSSGKSVVLFSILEFIQDLSKRVF